MTLVPLGEKTVDILVNGSQEASYTQKDEVNDYDINISSNGNVQNPLVVSFSRTHNESSSNLERTPFSVTGLSLSGNIDGKVHADPYGDAYIEIKYGDGQIDNIGTHTTTNDPDTVYFDNYYNDVTEISYHLDATDGPADCYADFHVDQSVNTNISVDSITQS
jgi:hypothetical protein